MLQNDGQGRLFILFASEAASGFCWPQGVWELLVVKFQPKTHDQNRLLWGSSHFPLPHQWKDAPWPSPALLPTGVLGDSICTPAAPREEEDLNEKLPLVKQARERLGPLPTSWSFPTSNQYKLYFTKARAGKAQVSISQAALGCACWWTAYAEQPLKWYPDPHQPKIRPGILHTAAAWAEDVSLLLTTSPPLDTKQSKTKDTLQAWVDGWMIWDLGLFVFLHLNEKE